MDAFYASVEQRDFPEIRGKPVVVGGSPDGRGVVAAASYEARKFGIYSAMPMAKAVRRCPDLIIQRHRFDYYREVSQQIRAIFRSYTDLVEPLSLDEAFLDVSQTFEDHGSAQAIGKEIKERVKADTKLTCSVGVAPNKFIAKIASDFDKPDGLVVVRPEKVADFLVNLPVSKIWGVGKATAAKLHDHDVNSVGDLRRFELHQLINLFGKWGARLHDLARGIDERPVVSERESKSTSRETTFSSDIHDKKELMEILVKLADKVHEDLKKAKLSGKTIQIKVRYGDFTTITRSYTLKEPTNNDQIIQETSRLLLKYKVQLDERGVRLIGVGVSNFAGDSPQLELIQESESDGEQTQIVIEDLQRSFAAEKPSQPLA
jgi:DNA polymerase-4